jgi:hypothetical protein
LYTRKQWLHLHSTREEEAETIRCQQSFQDRSKRFSMMDLKGSVHRPEARLRCPWAVLNLNPCHFRRLCSLQTLSVKTMQTPPKLMYPSPRHALVLALAVQPRSLLSRLHASSVLPRRSLGRALPPALASQERLPSRIHSKARKLALSHRSKAKLQSLKQPVPFFDQCREAPSRS